MCAFQLLVLLLLLVLDLLGWHGLAVRGSSSSSRLCTSFTNAM
jgi:hypothetical protein